MKRYIVLFTILFTVVLVDAQDLKINHYTFYRDGMNPASFTQNNDVNVFVLYNNEFSGFVKQPNTQIADVSFNLRGHKLGIAVVNDIVGYDKAQNIKIRYAKQFALSEKSFFSLGLSAGTMHRRLEATKMTFEFGDDPMSYSDYAETLLDFDFGTEFQFDRLFIGLSVTHLGKQFSNPDNSNPISHYYAYAQYSINSNSAFRFYPNIMARAWKNTMWAEAGVQTFYKNKVWLGLNYTVHHDMTFNTGMRVGKNIMFGYAFQSNLNAQILKPWGTNTHEVFLNFAINKERGNINSVRFID